MNLLSAFIELDKLENITEGLSREAYIDIMRKYGYDYRFEKYGDDQIASMAQRIIDKLSKKPIVKKEVSVPKPTCSNCGMRLTDGGECPVCDLGDETALETEAFEPTLYDLDLFMESVELPEWNQINSTSTNTQAPAASSGKFIVTIVSDNGRLRAIADDGINGEAFVAFPNNLRNFEGQQYEVDTLSYNGKNYRCSGNIVEI